MRHRWSYGLVRDAASATTRRCTACGATGRRWGKGSTSWQGRMPDGAIYSSRVPPCPGTPWVRSTSPAGTWWSYGDWNAPTRSGDGPSACVTRALVAQFGREHVEDMLRRNGHPPLPDEAWKDYAKVAD